MSLLRPVWLGAVVMFAAAAPLRANTPFEDLVGFKWCFQRGRSFFQEVTVVTTQSISVMGQDIAQTQTQTLNYRWQLIKHDAKTNQWQVRQKLETLKLEIDVVGQKKVVYDSTKPVPGVGNPPVNALGALVGVEFTVFIHGDGRVGKIEGCDTAVKKLRNAFRGPSPALEGIFGEAAMRSLVPIRPRGAAREWINESDLDLGAIGGYRVKHTFAEVGRDGKFDKIRVFPTLEYRAPSPGVDPKALPFTIKSPDLKASEGEGLIYLNRREGRIIRSLFNVRLKGTVTMSIGGTDTDVGLDHNQVITVKTFDADPLMN